MPQVGTPCHVSPVSGNGMKPSRLTMKMKSSSVATYGNQRLIALVGSPCCAICVWATSYKVSPIVCRRSGLRVRRLRMVRSPSAIVRTVPSIR